MATIPEALDLAVRHHQARELTQAEKIYRQILAVEPSHPDALHLLGVIASGKSNLPEAIDLISRAIAANPQVAAYHSNLGNALKDQGRLEEAVGSYQRALRIEPDFVEAHNNLGISLTRQGKLIEAVASYRLALEIRSNYSEAHYNLSIALKDQGKLDEAVTSNRRALQIKPDYVKAHYNLGNLLNEQLKFEEATVAYRQALKFTPEFAEAHFNLGNALREQRKFEEAMASYQRAVQITPDYAEAHSNLGNVLKVQGKIEEAIASYRRALQIKPNYADACNNLGGVLAVQGKLDEAVVTYRQALQIKPDYAEAHHNLGNTLVRQEKPEEAVASFQRALQISPDYVEAYSSLGNTLKDQGKLDKAVGVYQRALQIKPDYAQGHYNLGIALKEQGKLDEAATSYERALQIKPDYALAHFSLSQIKKFARDDPRIQPMKNLLSDDSKPDKDRILYNFVLGTAYDELGEYDLAFRHFSEGNQLKRQMIEYDPGDRAGYVSALVDFYTAEMFTTLGDSMAVDSETPIFIVGMPRSGTTLVEQILASHADVFGAGELRNVSELIPRLASLSTGDKDYPYCMQNLPTGAVRELAREYIEMLRQMAPGKKHITDKMPGNFFSLGLIALLWPNSKIIHCRRDPLAIGFSCYRRYFWEGQLFSWDLAEIGHYWRQYDRLWRHWRQVLPVPVLALPYEQLVENSEEEIHRILDHCGLPWDDNCLQSHRTGRRVQTTMEVRRPIYREALDHWRHYEHHLEPLIKAVDGELQPSGVI